MSSYESDHPEKQWFPDAGLGLFVHWGLSSIDGTVEMGFGMMEDKPWGGLEDDDVRTVHQELVDTEIKPEEYWALADEFDPDAFDPDRFLAAARNAGFEYAVLTAKHLAGFALWPSNYGDFGVAEHLDGRDLVGEFVRACHRQGMKVGLYYCLGDLRHPSFPGPDDADSFSYDEFMAELTEAQPIDEASLANFEEFYRYSKGQIKELVTRYGDLDVVWLDVPTWLGRATFDTRLHELYAMVEHEQPQAVLGREFVGGGDFRTPENTLPDKQLEGWWEHNHVWAPPNWSYHEDEEYYDMAWTHEQIARTFARGGNLLLNVGPRADGSLPPAVYDRFDALREWMEHSAPAVDDVSAGPGSHAANVPVTRRTNTWFAHVLDGHEGPIKLRDVPEPLAVRALRTNEPVEYAFDDGTVTVTLPSDRRKSGNEVVSVNFPARPYLPPYEQI
jgi:alpha-L-fucosidase